MNKQTEALLWHMDEEWQEDWDGKAIREELHRLNAELEAMTQCAKNHDASRTKYLLLNAELLEALRWIAQVNAMDYEYQNKARAAIAKAKQ